ncbi:LPS export ABC transporter periplasmic protein LptC [Lacinutrix undariae]
MSNLNLHIIKTVVVAFAMTTVFSCKNNYNEVQKIGILQNEPIGIAENINLKYTEKLQDTARLKANLVSPEMLDYSNRDFAFSEFPQGIHLTTYDDNGDKTVIISDYAIIYNATDLVDLQGNVVLATSENDTLFTDQLYYDQKSEWIFTNKPFTLRSGSEIINGNGLDTDSDFNNLQIFESTAIRYLDE